MRLLAIDPGETTGWVLANVVPQNLAAPPDQRFRVLARGTWLGYATLEAQVYYLFEEGTAVVVEDYRVYPHKALQHTGSELHTARMLGAVEWLTYHLLRTSPIYQTAAMAKGHWPNQRLKKHFPKEYKEYNVHEKDALRHLLTYIEKSKYLQFFHQDTPVL